jgi:hypothetical protein
MKYIPYIYIFMNVATMGDQIVESFPFWETDGEKEYPSFKKNTFAYKPISRWFGPKLFYIMVHPKMAHVGMIFDKTISPIRRFHVFKEIRIRSRNLHNTPIPHSYFSHPPETMVKCG